MDLNNNVRSPSPGCCLVEEGRTGSRERLSGTRRPVDPRQLQDTLFWARVMREAEQQRRPPLSPADARTLSRYYMSIALAHSLAAADTNPHIGDRICASVEEVSRSLR